MKRQFSQWWTLAALAGSVSLIVIDGTIVNVSLPVIISALGLTTAQAAWVSTIYALVFSALLIPAGRISDRIGRKTMLLTGVVLFVASSLMAAQASEASLFLAARACQGLGGAMVLPGTLSTVNATFFGKDRRIAFAVWGSVIAGMAAIGPLVGGWLTTTVNWRWIFLINLPIGILLLVGIAFFVPQTKDPHPRQGSLDVLGFITASVGLGSLVFGLIQGREYGWLHGIDDFADWAVSPALLAIIIGLALIGIFVVNEQRRINTDNDVLVDTRLFKIASFSWGNFTAAIVAMGEFALLFVLPLHLQNVLGLTALQSGWILAAMAGGAFISGGMAAPLAKKITAASVATLGLTLEAIGIAILAFVLTPQSSGVLIGAILIIYGLGLGLASAQLTSVVLAEIPIAQSGVASAVQSTVRQIGTALGVAVASTVFAGSLATYSVGVLDGVTQMPTEHGQQLEESLSVSFAGSLRSIDEAHRDAPEQGAHRPKIEVSDETRQEVFDALAQAATQASRLTIGGASIVVVIGALATLRLPRHRKDDD